MLITHKSSRNQYTNTMIDVYKRQQLSLCNILLISFGIIESGIVAPTKQFKLIVHLTPVSYTHLDEYKRQV